MANVPDLFPVSIDSRNYLVDLKQYTRQSLPVVREQADTSEERGEQSISPLDLWRRSQHSWHLGAGQEFFDDPDSERARFRESVGLNVFQKGKLFLLPSVLDIRSDVLGGSDFHVLNHNEHLYITRMSSGGDVEKSTDLTTFSVVSAGTSGAPGAGSHPITSDGAFVYWSSTGGTIRRYDGTSVTTFVTSGWTGGDIWFLKGRFMATQGTSIYNITTAGAALPSALYTHGTMLWKGMAEGPGHIYAAGVVGQKSYVYKIGLRPDGTALDAPIVAGELPEGETINTLYGYLGYLFIGTNKGVRMAEIDGSGDIIIGPHFGRLQNVDAPSTGGSNPSQPPLGFSTDPNIYAFEGQGQYVWFNVTEMSLPFGPGLARMDLRYFTQPLVPAYAGDLVGGLTPVTSICTVNNYRVFSSRLQAVPTRPTVFREHATKKVASGTLKTGWITYGLSDSKVSKQLEVIHNTKSSITDASIDAGLSIDDQEFDETVSVASQTTVTRPRMQFDFTTNPTGVATEVQLTLARSTGTVTDGPIVTQWTLRSMPIARRGEILVLPLMIKERVTQRNNVDKVYDTQAEFDALKLIERTGTPVTVQIGDESFEGWVDAVRWGDDLSFTSNGKDVQGILFVTVRRFY